MGGLYHKIADSIQEIFSFSLQDFQLDIVYDQLGKEITTLVNETKLAVVHKVSFPANNLPAGTYICRMQVGDFIQTKKLSLLK